MGKQINFYMLPSDEGHFLQAAAAIAPLSILEYTSKTEIFQPSSALPNKGDLGWFQVWLWSATTCQAPIVRWVPQQKYFVIDGSESEVIELARSYQQDSSIVRGRLWAELKKRDGTAKAPPFLGWFESLVRWIKKNYRKLPNGEYIAPTADEFVTGGGTLRQMMTAPVVKVVRH